MEDKKLIDVYDLLETYGEQKMTEEEFIKTFNIKLNHSFQPRYGETYYSYDKEGNVYAVPSNDCEDDRFLMSIGKVFETEFQARLDIKKLQYQKLIKDEFLRSCPPINWLKDDVYTFTYDEHEDYIGIVEAHNNGNPYCTTDKEFLQMFVDDEYESILEYIIS